ncbi:isoprenyl transferase [Deltaproteobacteria bacterium]|nr:isoprenyl transferase [Deltaproteobacteria bacterium]GHU93201.1 isoprenyl transferase [Deltaproteobacteria bacterium]
MSEQENVPDKLPTHIAVIMDGNGRWAEAKGLPRTAGHRAGAEAVRAVTTECRALGIRHLTLYTFSSENWGRPVTELRELFSLLREFLGREVPLMKEKNIALKVLGELADLPPSVRQIVKQSIKRTAGGTEMTLNLALNYGGRAELARAARALLREGASQEDVNEESLSARLYTAGQPDPDLLIRTGGEQRLSNYLLYQCAYTELYFTPVLWPDFREQDLYLAITAYKARSRRFGKI